MDDLCLFSKDKKSHFEHILLILRLLKKHGLKISPSKLKLFKTKLIYLGHEILIKDGRPFIGAMASKTDAIRKLPIPATLRKLLHFIGAVNYLSIYLPRLQEVMKPLYLLTKKKVKYQWGKQPQITFDTVKELLQKAPILTMLRR